MGSRRRGICARAFMSSLASRRTNEIGSDGLAVNLRWVTCSFFPRATASRLCVVPLASVFFVFLFRGIQRRFLLS